MMVPRFDLKFDFGKVPSYFLYKGVSLAWLRWTAASMPLGAGWVRTLEAALRFVTIVLS